MKNKPFTVIVGLGKTGLSCAQFLAQKNQSFAVMDSRIEPPRLKEFTQICPNTELFLGKFSENLLEMAEEIILSPGISLQEPLIAKQVAKGKSIVADIELFAREIKKPIIAITGSNGKTTVATLIGLMMKAAGFNAMVCGNIGEPVLQQIRTKADYYVIELSSFQLETTFSLHSKAAIILNISEDHMDRYATLQDYLSVKQRIYARCQTPVVNADEPEIWTRLLLTGKLLSFGLESPADFSLIECKKQIYITYHGERLVPIRELKLNAHHHLQNAMAALAIGTAVNIPMAAMLQVLRDFPGIRHRCQLIRRRYRVDYFNDSKGTNVGATRASIVSLGQSAKGRLILIAGGQGKGADFSLLRESVKRYVKEVILIGEDASILERALKGYTIIKHADSMNEAVNQAATVARAGDVVLLSPACASYDMFRNYEHRGDVFINIVEAL
ncbi:MAG: UDP-N-acetylmuramoyl-L-alanine--D-glutamate ligase [Coxiella-like endosymbiont]